MQLHSTSFLKIPLLDIEAERREEKGKGEGRGNA